MQKIVKDQGGTLTLSLAQVIRRPGGIYDPTPIVTATDCDYRVRTPSQTTSSAWTAVTDGFPIADVSASIGCTEGFTDVSDLSGSPGTVLPGDPWLVFAGQQDGSDCAILRAVGLLDGGETIRFGSPLPFDLFTGAKMYSLAVRVPVTAQQASEIGAGVAEIRVTDADGAEWVSTETFEIVRRVAARTFTVDRLQVLLPMVEQMRHVSDTTLQETIDAAWDSYVMPVLSSKGIREDSIRNDHPLHPAWAAAVAVQLATNNLSVPLDRLRDMREELSFQISLAMSSKEAWYQDDQSADEPMPPEGGDGVDFMRVTR